MLKISVLYTPFCPNYAYVKCIIAGRLSCDFSRRGGEKGPLREGGCPLASGEGRIGSALTV